MTKTKWITTFPGSITYRYEAEGIVNTTQGWILRRAEILYPSEGTQPGEWAFWEFIWRGHTYCVAKNGWPIYTELGMRQIQGHQAKVIAQAFQTALQLRDIPEALIQALPEAYANLDTSYPQVWHRLSVSGGNIVYLTCGERENPPVLCVHGWLGSKMDWRLLAPALCEHHYCGLIDLLGHGSSDKPRDADYSVDAQAQRVLAIADALELNRFVLCGHSMGAMIALYTAAALAPERVTGVINIAGVIKYQSLWLKALVKLAARAEFLVNWGFGTSRRIAQTPIGQRVLTSRLFYGKTRPEKFYEANLQYAIQAGMEVPFYRDLEAVLSMDIVSLLGQISCPVLNIFGQRDKIVPLQQGQLAAKHIQDQRLEVIPACGHYLILERPQQCLKALRNFEPLY